MAVTNDIGSRAQADLQRAEREAANARDKLARADSEINDLRAFLRKLEHYASPVDAGEQSRGARRPRGSGGKAKLLSDFCISEIRKVGKRVEIADLFGALRVAGMEIGGRDEKSNLAGYLSRDKRVNYVRGEGWGITNDDGAASMPDSEQAAPVSNQGGTDERSTLALPDDVASLVD